MKKQFFIAIILLMAVFGNAQDCFWAKQAGTAAVDEKGKKMAVDNNGNIFVIGSYLGNSITFGNTVLSGGTEYFLVKYSSNGTIQWAKDALGYAVGSDLAIDDEGCVYVTGYFEDTTTFGNIPLISNGFGDIFITKYDAVGNVIWAKCAGGSNDYDQASGIAYDNFGFLYVTGKFRSSTMTIGTTILMNNNLSGPNIFIAKYDTAGNVIWAKSAGGPKEDVGNSIISDGANVYVTGTFRSDSISFGDIYLHTYASGGSNYFLIKLDSSGNNLWTKGCTPNPWGHSYGKDIAKDTFGNIYVTGEFHGPAASFGTQTVTNLSSGSGDIFTVKYNSNGIALWAKSGGSSMYDYSYDISVDINGNVYIIGDFETYQMIFEQDTLLNSYYNTHDIFIVKYNTNGVKQWSKKIGGYLNDLGYGIAAGIGDNLYFTGSFSSTPLTLGNITLSSNGSHDMFVADMYSFSSSISSFSNISCYGGQDGIITTTATGGNLPYSYLWNTVPPQTNETAINLPVGTYTVTITEAYGCPQIFSVTLNQPLPDSTNICMVSVDSASHYNIIVWDKTAFTTIDSFIVYREIFTNNYQPIARIPYDSLSQFIDTVRTLYFPNTGDPNAGTYRYKIQGHYNCGNYTTLSPYHNTIYFLNNNGTFYWTQPYSIENSPNPVNSYVLMRDDNSTGNWHAVSSVTGSQQVINDPLYVIYQNTASWRVKTQWGINCSATNKNIESYNSSYSNIFTNNLTSIKENEFSKQIFIYPNPTYDLLTISGSQLKIQNFEIFNIIGESVFSGKNNNKETNIIIDISSLKQGVYFLSLKTPESVILKKIIKK